MLDKIQNETETQKCHVKFQNQVTDITNSPSCSPVSMLTYQMEILYPIIFQITQTHNIKIMDRNNENIMNTFKIDLQYVKLYMGRYILSLDFIHII